MIFEVQVTFSPGGVTAKANRHRFALAANAMKSEEETAAAILTGS